MKIQSYITINFSIRGITGWDESNELKCTAVNGWNWEQWIQENSSIGLSVLDGYVCYNGIQLYKGQMTDSPTDVMVKASHVIENGQFYMLNPM